MFSEDFKAVRLFSLHKWRKITERTEHTFGVSPFNSAYECQWQAVLPSDYHSNFFCNLGEFATHIDDMLMDERCDKIRITNCTTISAYNGQLFRYYSRILLIVEQLLEDFQMALDNHFPNDADSLKGFINKVIKHRSKGHLHFNQNNQHSPVYFEGEHSNLENTTVLCIENYEFFDPNSLEFLLLPPLHVIIDTILNCYLVMSDQLSYRPLFDGEDNLTNNWGVDNIVTKSLDYLSVEA